MKKKSFLFIFTSLLILASFVNAKEIKSTVILNKPEINYDESVKYEKTEEYSIPVIIEKKKYDFGFDLDINKEERTINYWKIDVTTNF